MQFLYPAFLYALPLVLVPLIIHLFNFRHYKTVYYSNIGFLKQVKEQNKALRTLKNFLTMLFRMLAIAALVLVFAGPFLPPSEGSINNNAPVIIYTDNSFSTEAEGRSGRLFETALTKAQSIVSAYDDNHDFLFLNNNFEPKHQHFVSKSRIMDFISSSRLSGYTKPLSEVISKAQQLSKENFPNQVSDLYIISDFQKSITNLSEFSNDSNLNVTLIPLKAEINQNLFIDSLSFEGPYRALNKLEKLQVKIVNTSDKDYLQVPLRLYLNDSLKVPSVFDIKAYSTTYVSLEYINTTAGNLRGRLEIDDYPVTFDNRFYFSLNIDEDRKILAAGDNTNLKYISSVTASDNYFSVDEVQTEKIKLSELSDYDVFVLNSPQTLSSGLKRQAINFVSDGGTLVLFAGKNIDRDDYNVLLQQLNMGQITGIDTGKVQIESYATESDIYANAFDKKQKNPQLPYLKNISIYSPGLQSVREVLLTDERNRPVLSKHYFGKGQVYFFAFGADESYGNFVFHPLWVPTLYNIFLLERYSESYYFLLGEAFNFSADKADYDSDKAVHLKSDDMKADYILERTGDRSGKTYVMPAVLANAGNYAVEQDSRQLRTIAVNYQQEESLLDCYTTDTLRLFIEQYKSDNYTISEADESSLKSILREKRSGRDLSSWFIIAVLVFILAEIISIRLINRGVRKPIE